jgi:hypothetical protein
MSDNIIKVIIQEGGKTAREYIDREKPEFYGDTPFLSGLLIASHEEKEKKLRTFEIDYSCVPKESKKLLLNGYIPDSKRKAKILTNNKIQIL